MRQRPDHAPELLPVHRLTVEIQSSCNATHEIGLTSMQR
jgi:hypothetical protein